MNEIIYWAGACLFVGAIWPLSLARYALVIAALVIMDFSQ